MNVRLRLRLRRDGLCSLPVVENEDRDREATGRRPAESLTTVGPPAISTPSMNETENTMYGSTMDRSPPSDAVPGAVPDAAPVAVAVPDAGFHPRPSGALAVSGDRNSVSKPGRMSAAGAVSGTAAANRGGGRVGWPGPQQRRVPVPPAVFRSRAASRFRIADAVADAVPGAVPVAVADADTGAVPVAVAVPAAGLNPRPSGAH
jgi:hypothetical protein